MNNDLHFSKASDEHPTPTAAFDALNNAFGPFTLDAAATSDNALCPNFYRGG